MKQNDYRQMVGQILSSSKLLSTSQTKFLEEWTGNLDLLFESAMHQEIANLRQTNVSFRSPFKQDSCQNRCRKAQDRNQRNHDSLSLAWTKKYKEFTEDILPVEATNACFKETTDHIICVFSHTYGRSARLYVSSYKKWTRQFGRRQFLVQLNGEEQIYSLQIGAISWWGSSILICGTSDGHVIVCDLLHLWSGLKNYSPNGHQGVTEERISTSPIQQIQVCPAKRAEAKATVIVLTQSEQILVGDLSRENSFVLFARYCTVNITLLIQLHQNQKQRRKRTGTGPHLIIQNTDDCYLVVNGTQSGILKIWEVTTQKISSFPKKKTKEKQEQFSESTPITMPEIKQNHRNTILLEEGPNSLSNFKIKMPPSVKIINDPQANSKVPENVRVRHCVIPHSMVCSLFASTRLLSIHKYGAFYLFVTADGYLTFLSLPSSTKTVFDYPENYELLLKVKIFTPLQDSISSFQEAVFQEYVGLEIIDSGICIVINKIKKGFLQDPRCYESYIKTLIIHDGLTIYNTEITLLSPPDPDIKSLRIKKFKIVDKKQIVSCRVVHHHDQKCKSQMFSLIALGGKQVRLFHNIIVFNNPFNKVAHRQIQSYLSEEYGANCWEISDLNEQFAFRYI